MKQNTKGVFVLLSKKYFSRYVLAYEVIPTSLCAKISGKERIDFLTLQALKSSGLFEENLVALWLSSSSCDDDKFISFSLLNSVIFPSEDSLSTFFERNYENFNINNLICEVIELPSEENVKFKGEIFFPEAVSKAEFTNKMMYEDGITALIHHKLIVEPKGSNFVTDILNHSENKNKLISFLLEIESFGSEDIELASNFVDICLQNGVDAGWVPALIHQQIINNSPSEIKESPQFKRWTQTVLSILNGDNVNLKFTDDGVIILRAIILVLLNPTLENLKAIKEQMKEDIGQKVFDLSQAFANLRFGYSFLNSSEREVINDSRSFIQDFRAGVLNDSLADLFPPLSSDVISENESSINDNYENSEIQINLFDSSSLEITDESSLDAEVSNIDISTFNWLSPTGIDIGYGKQFIISGLKTKAGFEMTLLYDETNQKLSLWVIDFSDEIKSKKYTGTFAKNIVAVQPSFPTGVRFEVNENGLVIQLPANWLGLVNLKENLESVISLLGPLDILLKSNKFCE